MSKSSLTPRQKDLLKLAVNGYRNKEIAYELKLAYPTVVNLKRRAFKALGISDDKQFFPMMEKIKAMLAE